MSKKVLLLLTGLSTAVLCFIFSTPAGPLPPLGPFFSPNQGFWANAETSQPSGEIQLELSGTNRPVEVFFDERYVPHIFAENNTDLYYAQGYVTARDRLFQMELQARAAGGFLSEWLGEGLVEYDRNQRRLGLVYGAEKGIESMMQDETMAPILLAYADGVNAYIRSLQYKSYPLEYKILNVEPEEWKPLKTALLLKYMTQMLAGRSSDVTTSNTVSHLGNDFVDTYLSQPSDFQDPIVPEETDWNFEPQTIQQPESLYSPSFTDQIERFRPDPLNGSNNWVADGSKTASGYPLLSNDMHLNMTIPAIWYEIQLRTPDSNVYGVSLQGAPTVIVGFNEFSAWGSTNTGADVMDWYEIEFRDESRNEYLHDGEWKPVERRIETIHVKGGETIQDTLLLTHHGPVVVSGSETPPNLTTQPNHALRWIAHDPSNELKSFYLVNRAKNYDDFKTAFQHFQAPAQNMNFGDVEGNIAIQTTGRLPLKWKYQGRTVGDGSDPLYDWTGFIPYKQNPAAVNPERGFLSAANQYPVSEDYPYYLGDSFAPFERGRRINDRLREMDNITVADYKSLLMDAYSYHAEKLLPVMLEAIEGEELSGQQSEDLENLAQWNYENRGDQIEPSLFYYWWRELYSEIWDDEYDTSFPMRRPKRDRTLEMILMESDAPWFDNIDTDETETLEDLIRTSFRGFYRTIESDRGQRGDSWQWRHVNNTNLNHVGQIPGMGVYNLFTDGGAESVNAIRGNHGPSWRMVVDLTPGEVKGYGVYPGGQSGNPGSKMYHSFVETWRTGELYELIFLREKPVDGDFPLKIVLE